MGKLHELSFGRLMKGMDFLFIADPLESFKVQKDSTLAMLQAAQGAGHRLWFAQSKNLLWNETLVTADCQSLIVEMGSVPWYGLGSKENRPLNSFSAVFFRTDPPFNIEYLNTTWLLSAAVRQGASVFNNPTAIREHSEKLSITEFPHFIPTTLVTRELSAVENFHKQYGDIIIKPLDGMG